MSAYHLHDSGDIVADAAASIESALRQALSAQGRASLMVSGGSSPKPLYERLSHVDLDWSNVTISLVDERWVDPGEAGSNEDFIRQNLIQNKAKTATFFGLKTQHDTVEAGLADAEGRFADVTLPFDVCVMGMGSDSHTASWFPHSKGLAHALAPTNDGVLCAIHANASDVTGVHLDRITLTLQSVLNSNKVILFIPSTSKRAVFDAAPSKPLDEAPVQALLKAGAKLHVFTGPAA